MTLTMPEPTLGTSVLPDGMDASQFRATTEHVWLSSTRYSDQPVSWGTRLLGAGGVTAIALLILGGVLITWTSYRAEQAPATLSVLNVAHPASPLEPAQETPPGPEQLKKENDRPLIEIPKIDPPKIRLPTTNPVAVQVAQPVPDPGPPVKETTAREAQPAPPAPHVSTGKPTWEGLVLGALNKVKRYPRLAERQRQQGVPWIRFILDREGRILSVRLERSSGFRMLDDEALSLPKRASPLPKPPEDIKGDTIELVVPVEFFMRRR